MVRPKIKPFRLLVSWLVAAAALFVAAWIVPHVEIQTFLGAVVVSLVIAVLNALIPPLVAAIRLPLTLVLGFLIVLVLDALMLLAASALTDRRHRGRQLLVGAPDRAHRLGRHGRPGRDLRDERRRHVHAPRHRADRASIGRARRDRRPWDRLPRDRRARAPRPPARDARRQRAEHGPLGRRRRPSLRRVGAGPLVADRSEPGGHPSRLEREHPRVPLGREGDGDDDGLLGARRLRGARAPPRAPASGCSRTEAPAAATSSRARPSTSSSRSAAWRRRRARTPATARSSRTVST